MSLVRGIGNGSGGRADTYAVLMSDDLFLFGDEPAPSIGSAAPAPTEAPIADWQVDLVRKVLDAQGLRSMAERQQAIEAVVGRPVESLRALTHEEALHVVEELGKSSASPRPTSAWDERDESTWIDRL